MVAIIVLRPRKQLPDPTRARRIRVDRWFPGRAFCPLGPGVGRCEPENEIAAVVEEARLAITAASLWWLRW